MTTDPRTLRTRKKLHDAVERLLGDRPLEEIGVAELCRTAAVHRTTFYNHYQSVGEVAADLYGGLYNELAVVELSTIAVPADIGDAYYHKIQELFQLIVDRRPIYRSLFGSAVGGVFATVLHRDISQRIERVLGVLVTLGVSIPSDRGLQAKFMAGGVVAILGHLARTDITEVEPLTRDFLKAMPPYWPQPRST